MKMMPPMTRRFVAHILLALVLLSAQAAGLAHTVSHLGKEPAKQEEKLLHLKLCDKCNSFEKLSFGPTSDAIKTVVALAPWTPTLHGCRSVETRCTSPYLSRAPPILL
jgi:hypothetical protein